MDKATNIKDFAKSFVVRDNNVHVTHYFGVCAVCLEEKYEGDHVPVVLNPCGHIMGKSCCQQLASQTCPSCRSVFTNCEALPGIAGGTDFVGSIAAP